ncbi:MAG: hypothetical protein R6U04_02265 [Bacteroidales bacterium]
MIKVYKRGQGHFNFLAILRAAVDRVYMFSFSIKTMDSGIFEESHSIEDKDFVNDDCPEVNKNLSFFSFFKIKTTDLLHKLQ